MGTLIIGSASNKAGVTIEPRTVLFNGDNVKYIKSGLTEIWSNIKALVPIMTSNTTPYGEVKASSEYQTRYAWKVFDGIQGDGNNTDYWFASSKSNQWIQYKFTTPACIKSVLLRNALGDSNKQNNVTSFNVSVSNDGNSWTVLGVFDGSPDVGGETVNQIKNDNYYLYYRLNVLKVVGSDNAPLISNIQFYGTQAKGLIPKMTSDTTPSGVASSSGIFTGESSFAYYTFDGNYTNRTRLSINTNGWVQYQFNEPKKAKSMIIMPATTSDGSTLMIKNFVLQGSNNGSSFTDIYSGKVENNKTSQYFSLNNETEYLYYRLKIVDGYNSNNNLAISELQLYGDF